MSDDAKTFEQPGKLVEKGLAETTPDRMVTLAYSVFQCEEAMPLSDLPEGTNGCDALVCLEMVKLADGSQGFRVGSFKGSGEEMSPKEIARAGLMLLVELSHFADLDPLTRVFFADVVDKYHQLQTRAASRVIRPGQ